MKLYTVISGTGEYEDYSEQIVKVFVSEIEADKFVERAKEFFDYIDKRVNDSKLEYSNYEFANKIFKKMIKMERYKEFSTIYFCRYDGRPSIFIKELKEDKFGDCLLDVMNLIQD